MEKNILLKTDLCQSFIDIGAYRVKLSLSQSLILGILGGAFISIGAFSSSIAAHSIKNPSLAKIASAFVFPIGLILIIICGGELFTGNSLLSISFFSKRITLKAMLKNWFIVYIANFFGAFIIAVFTYNCGLLQSNKLLSLYFIKVSTYKGNLTITNCIFSGILCNMLVCLAVWGQTVAKDVISKMAIAWFTISTFVLCGFEHSIANMYYFTISKFIDNGSLLTTAIFKNMFFVTFGNIIGGSLIIGGLYWYVYSDLKEKHIVSNNTINSNKI